MIIRIQEEIIKMDNDPMRISEYLESINKILAERNIELEFLIIDGKPVYGDFQRYFIDHIQDIEKVDVVVSVKPLITEAVTSSEQYLLQVIPQVYDLAEEFYKKANERSWIKLGDLFEGLQWIIDMVRKIDSIKNLEKIIADYEIWNEYVQRVAGLGQIIRELEQAMVNQDQVLIGDILLYEIIPTFEGMSEKLKLLLMQMENSNVS